MPKVKHDGQTWALCALCCLRNSYMAGVSSSWPKERCSVTKPFFFFTSFVGKRGLRIPWRRVPANVLFPGVVCRGGLQCCLVVSVQGVFVYLASVNGMMERYCVANVREISCPPTFAGKVVHFF